MRASRCTDCPGVRIYRTACSPFRARPVPGLPAIGSDDIFLLAPTSPYLVAQRGREVELAAGEATVLSGREAACVTNLTAADRRLGLGVARAALAPMLRDLDALLVRRLPAKAEPLRLLRSYVELIQIQRSALATLDLQRATASHICDLVALALGATRDAAEVAAKRGLAAARLQAIKADIHDQFDQPDLTLAMLARRHGITPRYIRLLFEREGSSFSAFLRQCRLAHAHRLLTRASSADMRISDIAYGVGFSDLSNFNRAFRKLYDASPSDVRARAASEREV